LISNHRFFDPKSTLNLKAGNWGGNMSLEKTGDISGDIFDAVYENHTHNNDVPKQLVQCVVKNVEL
jgi:hypothetical protein